MAAESAEPIEQWTATHRVALVISILKVTRPWPKPRAKRGLTVGEVEDWRENFLVGTEMPCGVGPRDEEALKDEQSKRLKQKIGDLVPDNDIYGRRGND